MWQGTPSLSLTRSKCLRYPTPQNHIGFKTTMILLGTLLNLLYHGSLWGSGAALDCVEAERGCLLERPCAEAYGVLEYCVAEEAVSPLGPDARRECLEAQSALQKQRPLQTCKCQRGARREEHCLRVYWTVRFAAYGEYEVSPYEDLEGERVRNMELSRMASIMAASSLPLDGQNQCLKAAQDCGLYEKCGSLRSEYVVACTKRAPGSSGGCNRQKCHRALRRFLERVPEEYSFALLFCPCSDALCGERRRKTIVPSCSYEERDDRPNCLSLQGYCLRDELCRSRLADFQHNCQPSSHSPSGCVRESGAVCLKAYAGLIGTIMTPNYVSNASTEVSQWCGCEGSGNRWQDCRHVLHMFTSNVCLLNAISSLGSSPPRPGENVPLTPPQPTPRLHQDKVRVYVNVLPGDDEMEDSEEAEEEEDEEEANSREFSIIPPYSEKDTSVESGARGSPRAAAGQTAPAVLLLLLPACALGWGRGV